MSEWKRVGVSPATGCGHYVAKCYTTAEFLNPPPRLSECSACETHQAGAGFMGSEDYASGVALIRSGWPSGAEQAREMAEKLDGVLAAASRRETYVTEWDVAGDEADVSRFLSGEPENMALSVPVPAEGDGGAVVRLAIKGGGSAEVGVDTFTRAAVLISAAVDRMEAAGRRVEVWVYYAAKFGTELAEVWHLLKRAEDSVDLPRLVAGLSAAAFRRVGWRWRESRKALKPSHSYGYSQASELPLESGEIRLDAVHVGRVMKGLEAEWMRSIGA